MRRHLRIVAEWVLCSLLTFIALVLLWLLATGMASAQTLTSITLTPPADGYHIRTNTGTVQLGTVCGYSNSTTDNCGTQTLTWGSNDTANMTVNSTGLATGAGGATNIDVQIYAYTAGTGGILGHHAVHIDNHVPTSLASRPETTSNQIVVGSTVLVSAIDSTTDSVGGPNIGQYCAWTTSDATKATVNTRGEVAGVAAGSATITCTYYGLTVGRAVTVIAPTLANNVWYVRQDGGTRFDAAVPTGQCDGKANVAYPGSGTNQHCAFSNPMYLFTDESSSTVYTGAVQPGDTAYIDDTGVYDINYKNLTTPWITPGGNGGATLVGGTPAQPTRIRGSNYASCTTDPDHPGNRTQLIALYAGASFFVSGQQNVEMDCIDLGTGQDCNRQLTGNIDFPCPNNITPFALFTDDFTSNLVLNGVRIHGFQTALTGTPGPGTTFTNTSVEYNYLDGMNFDNPFGYNGDESDGFTGTQFNSAFSGCTEEQMKPVSAVSRDGAGNLTVTFPTGAMVNYVAGSDLVLAGMTPADLNGTFPVTGVTFNQQTVSITGGSCVQTPGGVPVYACTFNTSTAPAFTQGSFVNITGETPAWLNGGFEVYSATASSFTVNASNVTRPGWTTLASMTVGSASTAVTVVASAAGAAESASVLGTAGHVYSAHRCFDQADGGFANGDGVGCGNWTLGKWKCDQCSMRENLQDGWDMLHATLDFSQFTRGLSEGNEGATVKFGNADKAVLNDDLLVSNCAVLLAFDPKKPPDFNQYNAMPCRASDGLAIASHLWSQMQVSNITYLGNQNTIWDDTCDDPVGCTSPLPMAYFYAQNLAVLGFQDTNNPTYNSSAPGIYFSEGGTPPWTWNNNLSIGTRNPPAGGANNGWTTDPKIVQPIPNISTFAGETAALTFDLNLQAGSPAVGAGIATAATPTTDYNGNATTSPPVVGALNLGGGPIPAPTQFKGTIKFLGNLTVK